MIKLLACLFLLTGILNSVRHVLTASRIKQNNSSADQSRRASALSLLHYFVGFIYSIALKNWFLIGSFLLGLTTAYIVLYLTYIYHPLSSNKNMIKFIYDAFFRRKDEEKRIRYLLADKRKNKSKRKKPRRSKKKLRK